jgi:glycosyltransferase involved in cell wall biosynthesis
MSEGQKYKVLILTDLEYGGVVTALINLLKHLDQQKIVVTVLAQYPYGPRYGEVAQYANVRPIQLSPFESCLAGLSYPDSIFRKFFYRAARFMLKTLDGGRFTLGFKMALRRFRQSIAAERYDVVLDFLGYGRVSTMASTYIACKRRATWIHDSDISFMRPIEKCYRHFDKIFCVSQAAADCVCKQYPELSSKVEIFYNILDMQKIQSDALAPIEDQRYHGSNIVLTIARLTNEKGIDTAIRAAEILKRNGLEFTWFVLGEGSERKEYEQLIAEKRLNGSFVLLGYVTNTSKYLQHCDVYVQPSRHEGYGLAIAEARILGKPIVASDLSAVREQLQDGETGLLCEPSPEQIAAKVQLLFHDDILYTHLQESAKNVADDYAGGVSKIIELCE